MIDLFAYSSFIFVNAEECAITQAGNSDCLAADNLQVL